MSTERLKEVLAQARHETVKVIIGQHDVIEKALIAIFTGNHALIEGVPGVAKTLLVRTLAHVLGCDFARIQFTPDLMPADITGTNVFNLKRKDFTLIKGPVFTSFLLADEINRAPAKTQSALLQAMQERLVTIDRDTHALPPNFTVFATQNPIEYEGTYPGPAHSWPRLPRSHARQRRRASRRQSRRPGRAARSTPGHHLARGTGWLRGGHHPRHAHA